MIGLTRGEYDSEKSKRSKEEKVFLMTSMRDLITQEEAAIACAKRRDDLCFIRFMIEQMSVPALNTCVKMLREGNERAKALFLLELLDMHQSKPMRVNMKEPVELEPMRKIDEIGRFSNVQEQIPNAFRSCGCEKYENYRGSSLLVANNIFLITLSEKCYELLCKIFSAVPERTKEELESILRKKFMGYASGNFSDFERQKQKGSTVTEYNAVDENDEFHRVMIEVEPLLEASGKRNWRSIMSTHDEFPCHCLLKTWWYPGRSNLVLIWDCGELLSMSLPDSSRPKTIVIVGVMMAIRWLEAHVKENNRQEAPTREQLQRLDCLKDLDLFETMCKILNIPMEVKKMWARRRLMPWFKANMTAWLYEYAKKHMLKRSRVYSAYQLDSGAGAFKRAFVTHRNAVTTGTENLTLIPYLVDPLLC